MRKRLVVLITALLLASGSLLSLAAPANAQRVWPLIGCDSLLNWPCPGPVLVNP